MSEITLILNKRTTKKIGIKAMGMKGKIFIFIILGIVIALIIRFVMLGKKSQEMNVSSSYKDGQLIACSSTSNCFESSQLEGELKNKISSATAEDFKKVKDHLVKIGFTKVQESDNYFHFTAKSSLFGFVDDVEFLINENGLQFRSASRVGKSDLGANKKRIITILEQAL